jgi:hypothetical protein
MTFTMTNLLGLAVGFLLSVCVAPPDIRQQGCHLLEELLHIIATFGAYFLE